MSIPNHGNVMITWRVGPAAPMAPCDYTALPSQTFELVLSAGPATRTLSLGNLYGFPLPSALSYCRRRGDRPASDFTEPIPNVVSEFTVYTGERETEFLAVRDGDWLHVLFRNAPTLVACSGTRYGPIQSCPAHEWKRLADVEIGAAELTDFVEDHGHPVDCAAPGCAFP